MTDLSEGMTFEKAKDTFNRFKHFNKLAYDENIHTVQEEVLMKYRESKGFIEGADYIFELTKKRAAKIIKDKCDCGWKNQHIKEIEAMTLEDLKP